MHSIHAVLTASLGLTAFRAHLAQTLTCLTMPLMHIRRGVTCCPHPCPCRDKRLVSATSAAEGQLADVRQAAERRVAELQGEYERRLAGERERERGI